MNQQERGDQLVKQLRKLAKPASTKEKEALLWVAGHMEMVDALLEEPITAEEEKELMRDALLGQDPFLKYIMLYHQYKKEYGD